MAGDAYPNLGIVRKRQLGRLVAGLYRSSDPFTPVWRENRLRARWVGVSIALYIFIPGVLLTFYFGLYRNATIDWKFAWPVVLVFAAFASIPIVVSFAPRISVEADRHQNTLEIRKAWLGHVYKRHNFQLDQVRIVGTITTVRLPRGNSETPLALLGCVLSLFGPLITLLMYAAGQGSQKKFSDRMHVAVMVVVQDAEAVPVLGFKHSKALREALHQMHKDLGDRVRLFHPPATTEQGG